MGVFHEEDTTLLVNKSAMRDLRLILQVFYFLLFTILELA